jgi:2-methylcitrate dehydratase PrpD
MSLTRDLVERAWRIGRDDVGDPDLEAVRTLLLDQLAVAAGGSATDSARAVRRFVLDLPGESAASLPIIGTAHRAPALNAAMANAVAGHSIEYDDVHNPSSSHPGVVIFPAALAAAALSGADGDDFVLACVAGYEVMCRVGRALNPPAHYARHFHPTATAGTLGAAATACRMLGMDVSTTVSALGIAADSAAGSMQFLVDGAWTKRWHPALAVRNGVQAALLARHGFRGPDDGIAGERGFLAGYSGDARPDELVAGWGERPLEVRLTSIKPHTTCRYNQAAVDAVLEVRRATGLRAEDVERVEFGLPSTALGIVCEPDGQKRRPRSIVDAQFSLPYSAAVALLRGRAGLPEFDGALLDDPEVVALMDLVFAEGDAEIDRSYPARWEAWVRVTTTDGRTLRAHVVDAKGDPGNPLSLDELRAKFDELTQGAYSLPRREEIVEAVGLIDRPGSVARLLDALEADLPEAGAARIEGAVHPVPAAS